MEKLTKRELAVLSEVLFHNSIGQLYERTVYNANQVNTLMNKGYIEAVKLGKYKSIFTNSNIQCEQVDQLSDRKK